MKKIISIPPNYFYLCMLISVVSYFIYPYMNVILFPFNLIGIILLGVGVFFIISPLNEFKKYNTPERFEKSTHLVTTGLYSWSRNPQYLGGIIFLTGLSILLGNVISFISPIIFFSVMHFMFIPYEEDKNKLLFEKNYLDYEKNVRKWI